MSSPPKGGGFLPRDEWRKDRPSPVASNARYQSWYQYYLGDVGNPELGDAAALMPLQGSLGPYQQQQREVYAKSGVATSVDKSVSRSCPAVRMGAQVDGVRMRVGFENTLLLRLIRMTLCGAA